MSVESRSKWSKLRGVVLKIIIRILERAAEHVELPARESADEEGGEVGRRAGAESYLHS